MLVFSLCSVYQFLEQWVLCPSNLHMWLSFKVPLWIHRTFLFDIFNQFQSLFLVFRVLHFWLVGSTEVCCCILMSYSSFCFCGFFSFLISVLSDWIQVLIILCAPDFISFRGPNQWEMEFENHNLDVRKLTIIVPRSLNI